MRAFLQSIIRSCEFFEWLNLRLNRLVWRNKNLIYPSCQIVSCLTISRTSLYFFLLAKFRNKRAGKQKQKNQPKVYKHGRRYNLRYNDVNRDGNPQRENVMDSLSFEGFHTQWVCKFTYGIKIKHKLIITVSQRLSLCWGPSQLDHHDNLRSSQWRKPQKLHRAPI